VDYCNAVFAGAPRNITDSLQWVLNAATCIVSDTQKFDHGLTNSCTPSFIGLTFQNESNTNSVFSCTDANMTELLDNWWITAHPFPTSFSVNTCAQLVVTNSEYHAISSARTAVRPFLSLSRLSGTHYLKTFGIRNVLLTLTVSCWRHFYYHSISVSGALEVLMSMHYKLTFDTDTDTDIVRQMQKFQRKERSSIMALWICKKLSIGFREKW